MVLAVIVAVFAALSGLTAPAPTPVEVGTGCDVRAVVAAVDARSDAAWRVRDLDHNYLATTGYQSVWVDPDTPCSLLPSVVVHEWVHLLQLADAPDYPTLMARWTPEEVELVADCGSWMFGQTYQPYASDECRGCGPTYYAEAKRLIGDQIPPLS